jgi:hypothetical protein
MTDGLIASDDLYTSNRGPFSFPPFISNFLQSLSVPVLSKHKYMPVRSEVRIVQNRNEGCLYAFRLTKISIPVQQLPACNIK